MRRTSGAHNSSALPTVVSAVPEAEVHLANRALGSFVVGLPCWKPDLALSSWDAEVAGTADARLGGCDSSRVVRRWQRPRTRRRRGGKIDGCRRIAPTHGGGSAGRGGEDGGAVGGRGWVGV